jgi:hypothetical protein
MMRALKRLAHYSRIDAPRIVSFFLFPMGLEPRTTLQVYFSELRKAEVQLLRIYVPRTLVNKPLIE